MFKTLIYDGEKYKQFEINEQGKIRNKKTGTVYKNVVSKRGYYVVTLPMGKRGVVKSIRVHKALAEVFIPNPKKLTVVNHKDENKLNIKLSNLEWVTSRTNTTLYLKNKYKKDKYANNRKLTKEDVKFIRSDKVSSYTDLANYFGVSKTTISNVKNNYFYK